LIMMNKKELTAFAKNILHSHKQLRSPQIMHPAREWFIGLLVAAGIFGVCAFVSVQAYLEHRHIDLTVYVDETSTATVYRESLVEAALDLFSSRSQRYDELQLGATPLRAEEEPEVETSVATSSTVASSTEEVSTTTAGQPTNQNPISI